MRAKSLVMCALVLCLVLASSVVFAGIRYEALINQGFEDGAAPWIGAYWGGFSETIESTPELPARTGNYMRYLHGTGNPYNVVEQGIGANNGTVPIPPGTVVHCGAWIMCPDATALNPCTVAVRPRPDNGVNATYYWFDLTDSDWHFVGDDGTGAGIVMPSGTWLAWRVYGPADRDVYVDDCQALVDAYNITGRVVDTASQPVEGATVNMYLPGSTDPITTTTDALGEYSLIGGPGQFTVSASKPNYWDSMTESVEIVDQDIVVPDLVLEKLPTNVISGKVLVNGVGLEGAEVSFSYYGTGELFGPQSVNVVSGPGGDYTAEIIQYSLVTGAARKDGYRMVDPGALVDIMVDQDIVLDIPMDVLRPLIDIKADDLAVGSPVVEWPNTGLLGGKFVSYNNAVDPVPGFPMSGGANYKGVTFLGGGMQLVDDLGNPVDAAVAAPGIVGGGGMTNPEYTVMFWAHKSALAGSEGVLGLGPQYKCLFNYGAGWAIEQWDSIGCFNTDWNTNTPAGSWHQVVVTNQGTTQKMFFDGVLKHTFVHVDGTYLDTYNSPALPNIITLGCGYNADSTRMRSFAGSIAALQVYDIAMSDEAAAALYLEKPLEGATYTVSGNVYGPDGTTAVDGATVQIKSGGTVLASMTTGADGAFALAVSPGSYKVVAMAPGYAGAEEPIDVVDADVVVNLTLTVIPYDPVIDIEAAYAEGSGWINNGVYGGAFTALSGTIAPSLVGPEGEQRLGVTFTGAEWLRLQKDGAWVAAGSEITGKSPHTVIAWLFDPIPTSGDSHRDVYISWAPQGIASIGNGMYLGMGWQVWGSAVCGFDAGATPTINWPGSNGDFNLALTESTAPWGRWAQVATVYDGTAYKIYVDGVERTDMAKNFATNTATGYGIYLGGSANGGADNAGRWGDTTFTGTIGRLKMWARALDATEVQADFADAPPVISPVLLSGFVTNNGSPIYGVTVVLYKKSLSGSYDMVLPTAETDTDGYYEFSVLAGEYRVVAFLGNKIGSVDCVVGNADLPNQNIALLDQGGDPLIKVNANSLPDGELTSWQNLGTAGGQFDSTMAAKPVVQEVAGHKAVSFNGNSRMLSDFFTPLLLTKKTSFTASAWVYNAATPKAEETIIAFAPMWAGSGAYTYWLVYGSDTGWGLSDWGDYGMGSATIPAPGAWHHIVMSYDNSADSATIYVDNAVATSAILDADLLMGGRISIGAGYDAGGNVIDADWGTVFTGSIAGIEVYAQAKTAAEVADLYNNPPWNEVVAVDVADLAALKAKAGTGEQVRLTGAVTVAADGADLFFIGEAPYQGTVKVAANGFAVPASGSFVTNLMGVVSVDAFGQYTLTLSAAPEAALAGAEIKPLGMNNKSAKTDAKVLTNLVRVWGSVSGSTIDDGYGNPISVVGGTLGTGTVAVTGVLWTEADGSIVLYQDL